MTPLTWDALEPRLQALLDRPLAAADVAAFLLDVDAIEREVYETYAGLMRAKDEDTSDESAAAAFLAFVQDVLPRLAPVSDALNRKLLAVPGYVPPPELEPAWADLREAVDLYRAANVPLQAQEEGLRQRYGVITGRTRVVLDGEEVTVAAARAKLDEPDRDLRERAYRAIEDATEAQRADLDALFLEFVALRHRVARNADLPDYRAYAWRERHRRAPHAAAHRGARDGPRPLPGAGARSSRSAAASRCVRRGPGSDRPQPRVIPRVRGAPTGRSAGVDLLDCVLVVLGHDRSPHLHRRGDLPVVDGEVLGEHGEGTDRLGA